jgi:ABC-type branched-subunit amino acid transport system ATPase component
MNMGWPAEVHAVATEAVGRPIISARSLSHSFQAVRVVDDVSIDIDEGRLYGLIGPNGAGKSTVLNILAGAQKPVGGSVKYDGVEVTRWPAYRRARHGIIRTFQLSNEFARLTVLENLLVAVPHQPGDSFRDVFTSSRRRWQRRQRESLERARALLARFSMEAKVDDYAGNLSGGQKRILEILRAVMAHPRVLLLDEPLAGIHPRVIDSVCDYLRELRGDGVTILMIEHELEVVESLCDAVVVMANGSVLFRGSMTEARQRQEVIDAYVAG